MSLLDDNGVDYNRLIIKSLYLGMFMNILIPMAGLLVCYYLDKNSMIENKSGDIANGLFVTFAILSLLHAGYALWKKGKIYRHPMVRRIETLEQDIAEGILQASRPVYIIIASISLYGYLYFFLTGRFQETVFLVFISFLVFQVFRPRIGFIRTVVKQQQTMVKNNQFKAN